MTKLWDLLFTNWQTTTTIISGIFVVVSWFAKEKIATKQLKTNSVDFLAKYMAKPIKEMDTTERFLLGEALRSYYKHPISVDEFELLISANKPNKVIDAYFEHKMYIHINNNKVDYKDDAKKKINLFLFTTNLRYVKATGLYFATALIGFFCSVYPIIWYVVLGKAAYNVFLLVPLFMIGLPFLYVAMLTLNRSSYFPKEKELIERFGDLWNKT